MNDVFTWFTSYLRTGIRHPTTTTRKQCAVLQLILYFPLQIQTIPLGQMMVIQVIVIQAKRHI